MAPPDNNKMSLIIPILSFFGALFGLYHHLKTVEDNKCDMTYMFEYPEYMKIPLNYSSSVRFPRYNLFVYGEGKYAEELSAHRHQGTPVLFIPGNAGSHRQVRSLASVALRMRQSRQTTLHFNFFTIDFNEEISALYGGTLNDQTEFVQECVKHILSLYSEKKKLILIGHSMGGVIAKTVFSLPTFDPSDIAIILTLASPHQKPVIAIDSAIVYFYERMRLAWKYRLKEELRNIPIISIGGGQRDILVRSDLIINNFDHSSALDIHVLTSAIPGVWVSTDHLAIVWCKQLVLTVCRSLFDLSDLELNQETRHPSIVENVLKFHYISRSSGNHWPSLWFLPARTFPSSGQWIEQEGITWRFSRSKVLSSIYILIPLLQRDNILIVVSGLMKGDWLFGCTQLSKSGSKTCVEGENLSNNGEIIPSRKANLERRIVNFKTEDLRKKEYLSLLIYIAPVDSQIEILGETYSEKDRIKHYNLPSAFDRLFSYAPHRVFTISLVEQIVYYNVTVSRSAGIFQAVDFQLETRLCRAGSVVGQGLIKLHIPWSNEQSYYHIRTSLGGLTSIPVIIHSLPPADVSPDVNFLFILDPECSVVLTARFPLYLMASQFMKFYGTYVIGYTVAFLLVLLSEQMRLFGSQGVPFSVYKTFGKVSSFFILVIVPCISYHLMWASGFSASFLPKPDEITSSYNLFTSFFLRTLLYLIASGFVICLYTGIEIILRAVSAIWIFTMHKNILQNTQMPLESISKKRVEISKTMLVWSSILAAICVGVSSSVASVITSVYYFFKLVFMHTRCKLEEERRGVSVATCKWYFHAVLVLLWFAVFLLTCPGFITWLKNVQFSFKLTNDVYALPCTAMIISLAFLWQLPVPIIHRNKYEVAAGLIQTTAVVTTLFGISSVYRLLYYIATSFTIVCIHQTYGYFQGSTYLKHD